VDTTEEKSIIIIIIIPDAEASTYTAVDGTTSYDLFEELNSVNHKQVRSVLDGYDMREMSFGDATNLI
jgi:hypothetical protein